MSNLTLGKLPTALVNAGRLRVAQQSQGDFWATLKNQATVTEYNNTVNAFNSLRSQIHDTITAGFTVTGTKENGDPQALGDDADGPIILTLPT